MAESGGQPGNDNAKRGMEARESLRRSLCKIGMKLKVNYEEEHSESYPDDGLTNFERGMDSVSDCMLIGVKGQREIFNEVANRFDGKPAQSLKLSGEGGGAIDMKWTVEVVEPDHDADN